MKAWIATIVVALAPAIAYACWNSAGTCTSGAGSVGQACKSPGVTPKVCFIELAAGCYRVYNSTGKDVFIPTKTASEFANFAASPGAGVTVTGGLTRGTNCFPSCYMNSTGCPGVPNSTTNPP
ncbi:MAG: hypothetical protein AB7H97_16380 [Pseudobdellovibrionaceae bacterium]